MKKSLLSVVAGAVLLFSACGSDSAGEGTSSSSAPTPSAPTPTASVSSSGGGDAQAEAADLVIEEAKDEGIDLDVQCVNDITAELSDEDAEAIVAAGVNGDPDVSDAGDATGAKLATCADNDQLVEAFIEELKGSGQSFDEQCVRDSLEGANLAELATSDQTGSSVPTDLIETVFACFDLTTGT